MMRYDGNGDLAWNDDIYNQGFDDGRADILATLARINKEYPDEWELMKAIEDFLEDEGYL